MTDELKPKPAKPNKRPTGVRHTLILQVDVAMDDQTDSAAMAEIVEYWIKSKIDEDSGLTGITWPSGWNVMHVAVTLLMEDVEDEAKDA